MDTIFPETFMNYEQYRKLIDDLMAQKKVTGPNQSDALIAYTRLNIQRMSRIDKTIQLLPEAKTVMEKIAAPQNWWVLTEGWCGDASQIVPALYALSKLNPAISLRFVLRDENPALMDRYLTNGVSRSIPKLIVVDGMTGKELFNWGPRPAPAQAILLRMKAGNDSYEKIKDEIHHWYAKDKTFTTQQELIQLLSGTL